MKCKILAINPGSTSTKIALYEDEKQSFAKTINHNEEDLAGFDKITDQYLYRKKVVEDTILQNGWDITDLSCVVGRGGIISPIKGGGYLVNDKMKNILKSDTIIAHASNLGAIIADEIAMSQNIPAFIYDGIGADEMHDIAKITGLPQITRQSLCHVLNSKATARKVAEKAGKKYNEMNFLVAHLGGGISISAHQRGKIIDIIADDSGPFSPERSGSIPLTYIVDLCYSGKYTKKEATKLLRGLGGIKAHLGTSDCREVERRVEAGDAHAREIYEAMAYQIAKGVGNLCTVFRGEPIDKIILTGGLAYSKMLTDWVARYISFLAPIEIVAGENEMEALALGALRIMRGEESYSIL